MVNKNQGRKVAAFKKRCGEEKCNKLAKDNINNVYLCRVHSPMRVAYKTAMEDKNDKQKR
jgi:hypothetical protein